MYGGILVDPATPLPPVEHELYMVQSEYYTTGQRQRPADDGSQRDHREDPSYVVFNGAIGSLTGNNAPQMQVGEHMRIYFVNAGLEPGLELPPDRVALGHGLGRTEHCSTRRCAACKRHSFRPAAAQSSRCWRRCRQTIVLVDHALARAFDKGAIGQIVVTGDPNPEIYQGFPGANTSRSYGAKRNAFDGDALGFARFLGSGSSCLR